MHFLLDNLWYYFGHSGYEYIDLGKFFQIALLVGLVLWFVLMYRAIRPYREEVERLEAAGR